MSEIITAKDIYKTFQTSSGEVHALNGINLILEKGLFYAIIGKVVPENQRCFIF